MILNYDRIPLQTKGKSPLEIFFTDELKSIYSGEKLLLRALIKMGNGAKETKLKQVFDDQSHVTLNQIVRLEEVFDSIGIKPESKKCDSIEGFTGEADRIIEDTDKDSTTRDLALILIAQKMEHYEIATYGGLSQLARTLDYHKVARLLEVSLSEETKADCLLAGIAENYISYDDSRIRDRIWF